LRLVAVDRNVFKTATGCSRALAAIIFGLIKKVDSLFKFETVSTYVSEWTTLGLDFDRLQNPLRQEPSDNAAVILNEDTKKYKIWRAEKIEMKGDWLKVKTKDKKEGWIRWRRDDKIIIQLYFAC
jgi:hypothetical protein